jgi:hypothetical protein
MKGLEVQQRCGEPFLSDSHSWQEALLAVWYVCRFFNFSVWAYFLRTDCLGFEILVHLAHLPTYYGYAKFANCDVSQNVALLQYFVDCS